MAPKMQYYREMMPATESADDLALELDLRVDAAPDNGLFKATIELREIELVVEAVSRDISEAMRSAATRCSERLNELGYEVTPADVLGALEERLEPISLASTVRS